jgi:hypothetical protein
VGREVYEEKMWKVGFGSVKQVDGKGGDFALNRNELTHNNEKRIDVVWSLAAVRSCSEANPNRITDQPQLGESAYHHSTSNEDLDVRWDANDLPHQGRPGGLVRLWSISLFETVLVFRGELLDGIGHVSLLRYRYGKICRGGTDSTGGKISLGVSSQLCELIDAWLAISEQFDIDLYDLCWIADD